MFAPSIVVVDVDAGIPEAEIVAYAAAQEKQILAHFGPAWGVIATVRAATASSPPRDDEWLMELRKVPTVEGALGYHDETAAGNPLLYVFPELCKEDGTTWTSCASHEVLETLADPLLNLCAQNPDDGKIYALEVCDAVEVGGYSIDGVPLSNFVTRTYFSPPKDLTGISLDHLGLVKTPYQILDGGYSQWLDSEKGWQQIVHSAQSPSVYRQKISELKLSRGSRR